ncbi:hypothetical protein SeMB42_g03885 [Synchytrium endobioticum]|uniref:Uncharacterized protein n=1 Tax=Synchytrium endobioticum TaxID=286115 RepID=A0A507D2N3_9FUNG|nr:hypothetical protein SeMB42_g03885 [Synchytrium endobioticum]
MGVFLSLEGGFSCHRISVIPLVATTAIQAAHSRHLHKLRATGALLGCEIFIDPHNGISKRPKLADEVPATITFFPSEILRPMDSPTMLTIAPESIRPFPAMPDDISFDWRTNGTL